MPQSATVNRRILLVSRPVGPPTPANFQLDTVPVPVPGPGQVLLRNELLSLDPYMRGRMSDAPSYAEPVAIGAPMGGGTIARVEASHLEGYAPGDYVLAYGGWQDYALSNGEGVSKLWPGLARRSYALGVLGMPGYTGYHGLLNIGEPKAGETVVVAAATGAVGSVVGQVAKLKGCRVVGIAGGADKCAYATRELGFDACVDHRAPDLRERLKAQCPRGIDVYFENVGGAVFSAVLPLLNVGARVPVCGLIALYNATSLPAGPDLSGLLMRAILVNRLRVQGFIITDHYGAPYSAFVREMSGWLASGEVRYREHVVEGLEQAPQGFIDLMRGANFGKVIVRLAQD